MKNKKNTIAVISILVAVFAVMGLALFFLAKRLQRYREKSIQLRFITMERCTKL